MNMTKLLRGAMKYVNNGRSTKKVTRTRKNVAGAVGLSYPACTIFSDACASSVGLPGRDSSSHSRNCPCFLSLIGRRAMAGTPASSTTPARASTSRRCASETSAAPATMMAMTPRAMNSNTEIGIGSPSDIDVGDLHHHPVPDHHREASGNEHQDARLRREHRRHELAIDEVDQDEHAEWEQREDPCGHLRLGGERLDVGLECSSLSHEGADIPQHLAEVSAGFA